MKEQGIKEISKLWDTLTTLQEKEVAVTIVMDSGVASPQSCRFTEGKVLYVNTEKASGQHVKAKRGNIIKKENYSNCNQGYKTKIR